MNESTEQPDEERGRRSWIRRIRDYCVYRILRADDPPHRLALGIAIGTFATFTPFIGLQMVLCIFLAWVMGANKVVGIPIVWISNPLTIIPIYYPCYALGCTILGAPFVSDNLVMIKDSWNEISAAPSTRIADVLNFWWSHVVDVAWPLLVGCTVVGLALAFIFYYASMFAIRKYRLSRWGQMMPPISEA